MTQVSEYDVDPVVWFGKRQLEYPPVHFIYVSTPLTTESKQWVLNNLRGRFAVTLNVSNFFATLDSLGTISFEDPSEATMYELRWS